MASRKLWSVVGVAFLCASSLWAQQNFDAVEVKAQFVAGKVYMMTGAGGNIGVTAGEDGVLIVDDQFAPLADKIRAALKGLNPGELKFILNTHWHGDHTGGNAEFGPEATIIAHTNVRRRLAADPDIGGRTGSAPPEAWPVITFDDSVSVHFNGEEIRAIHLPAGHTDGDSVIFFTQSKVVHMGDQFFNKRFPFVDLNSGGNALGYAANVARVIEKLSDDVKIIPGHGELATLDDLKLFHKMLEETIETVRGHMRNGKSLDEIKAEGLPDTWEGWGSGFISDDRWIEIIYRSLIG